MGDVHQNKTSQTELDFEGVKIPQEDSAYLMHYLGEETPQEESDAASILLRARKIYESAINRAAYGAPRHLKPSLQIKILRNFLKYDVPFFFIDSHMCYRLEFDSELSWPDFVAKKNADSYFDFLSMCQSDERILSQHYPQLGRLPGNYELEQMFSSLIYEFESRYERLRLHADPETLSSYEVMPPLYEMVYINGNAAIDTVKRILAADDDAFRTIDRMRRQKLLTGELVSQPSKISMDWLKIINKRMDPCANPLVGLLETIALKSINNKRK